MAHRTNGHTLNRVEMHDVTGRRFYWQRRQERPLECIVYEGSVRVGSILERSLIRQVQAEFAGLIWDIDFRRSRNQAIDRVGFAEGRIVIAEGSRGLRHYRLDVDTGESYRLVRTGQRLAEWQDADGAIVANLWSADFVGSAGELDILPDAPVLHAPLLVIVGALRSVRHHLFPILST